MKTTKFNILGVKPSVGHTFSREINVAVEIQGDRVKFTPEGYHQPVGSYRSSTIMEMDTNSGLILEGSTGLALPAWSLKIVRSMINS